MDLINRKILITGANGGLGRAMAVSMAENGAMLALCERTQELAEAAKAALPEPVRAQAHAFAADLTDADAVATMVSDSAATLQGLDGLVNNAAILTDDDTDPVTTSLDSWRTTLEVNVTGAFLMCKNVLPLFLKQKRAPS